LTLAVLLYASGETKNYYNQSIGGKASQVQKVIVRWDKESAGGTYVDMNDVDVSFNEIYGYIERVTIDSNGTETAYTVSLVDNDGFTVFTKTDCNSVTEPHSLAVYLDDLNGDPMYGVPVGGSCSLTTDNITQNAELQTCTPDAAADANTFTITYSGETTTDLAYDANTATIQTAFRLLTGCSAVTAGGVGLNDGNDLTLTWPVSSGNVTGVTFDCSISGSMTDVTVVETTQGGSALDLLKVIIYYRQQPQ